MADFISSFDLLQKWENRNTDKGIIIYSNYQEDTGGETVYGVARASNPQMRFWKQVDYVREYVLKEYESVGKKVSVSSVEFGLKMSEELMRIPQIKREARDLYYSNYWLKLRCDVIKNDKFAKNLFLLGVNAGVKRGVKVGQEACGISVDGVIGPNTLKAWELAGNLQAIKFTEIEINYYRSLVEKNPKNKRFLQGWINRAKDV